MYCCNECCVEAGGYHHAQCSKHGMVISALERDSNGSEEASSQGCCDEGCESDCASWPCDLNENEEWYSTDQWEHEQMLEEREPEQTQDEECELEQMLGEWEPKWWKQEGQWGSDEEQLICEESNHKAAR